MGRTTTLFALLLLGCGALTDAIPPPIAPQRCCPPGPLAGFSCAASQLTCDYAQLFTVVGRYFIIQSLDSHGQTIPQPVTDACVYSTKDGSLVAEEASKGLVFFTCPSTALTTGADCCPVCTPSTCATLSPKCGPQDDGCGGTITCGCTLPQTCGGGGTSNVCGCPCTSPGTCQISTGAVCTASGCVYANAADGATCSLPFDGATAGEGADGEGVDGEGVDGDDAGEETNSGVCSAGVCIDPCAGNPCNAPGICQISSGATCSISGTTHKCFYHSAHDGTACNGGVCSGGSCVNPCSLTTCNTPGDCHVSSGAQCTASGTSAVCTYPVAPDGTQCKNNAKFTCARGVCSKVSSRHFGVEGAQYTTDTDQTIQARAADAFIAYGTSIAVCVGVAVALVVAALVWHRSKELKMLRVDDCTVYVA